MKINFITDEIKPMYDWLVEGHKDEKRLREILKMPGYKVEFDRYGDSNLPVCGISFEEAVDFFLNFDEKDFSNPRLNLKKQNFIEFYSHIEEKSKTLDSLMNVSKEDLDYITDLLKNGLPDSLLNNLEYNVMFLISIGNSMGWPYENYIDFDVANIDFFKDKKTYLSVIAHEIHHTLFGKLVPEDMRPEELFLINFAYEGMAVHFNNNAYTKGKPSKYSSNMIGMSLECWKIYEEEFDLLFDEFKMDYEASKNMSFDEVQAIVSEHYEQFYLKNLLTNETFEAIQYPTYYLGCYFFGSIDLAFGKEKLFEVLKEPQKLVSIYNESAKKLGNEKYIF